MDSAIERLIGLLDNDSTAIAEGAKAELISIGPAVVPQLIAGIGSLDRYGQLSAIEVFEHCHDAAAGPAPIGLLISDDRTVREWSAWALAELGVREGIPELKAAYERHRATGDPPDDSEAIAIRRALTTLGARQPMLPLLTASLLTPAGSLDKTWPSSRLADVLNDLADHGQVVLYFQLWYLADGGTFWNGHEALDQELDFTALWPQLVETARENALIEASTVSPRENLFATIEWIDQADL